MPLRGLEYMLRVTPLKFINIFLKVFNYFYPQNVFEPLNNYMDTLLYNVSDNNFLSHYNCLSVHDSTNKKILFMSNIKKGNKSIYPSRYTFLFQYKYMIIEKLLIKKENSLSYRTKQYIMLSYE